VYAVRRWSVRHARFLESLYRVFGSALERLDPVWQWCGYSRIEKPMVAVERTVKEFLFDCRMCGRCVLSSTGMSCPMNCPKQLRNGPCGGVREGGYCEIKPEMRCVWVEAWEGSGRMREGDAINTVQLPVDQSLQGSSSWLRAARERAAERRAASEGAVSLSDAQLEDG
jgi:hypothetical protein